MPFVKNGYTAGTLFKRKQSNQIIRHELSRNGLADQLREFLGAQREILLDLDHPESVGTALRLHRKNMLSPMLLCFDLFQFARL